MKIDRKDFVVVVSAPCDHSWTCV